MDSSANSDGVSGTGEQLVGVCLSFLLMGVHSLSNLTDTPPPPSDLHQFRICGAIRDNSRVLPFPPSSLARCFLPKIVHLPPFSSDG